MIPYGKQHITKEDIAEIVKVMKSDFLTQGKVVPDFEKALESALFVDNAVAVNSATSALHIACLSLGLGEGDYLWTTPNTFVASANCARYCGANVDFVDIDSSTYNMSVDSLERKLEKSKKAGQLPKIVVPVHFAGQPCDMKLIHELSLHYNFKIIEDASHAIGASYFYDDSSLGKDCSPIKAKIGSCVHSDITVMSFHPVKIITTGEGGVALTNDKKLADKMRRLRSHGITNDNNLFEERATSEIWNYQQIELGYNYRMTDIQAALGLSQLQRLPEYVHKRRKLAENYYKNFKNKNIKLPKINPNNESSFHLFPVCVKNNQKSVYELLRASGIGVNIHYIPVHLQPYYQKLGFKEGDFPNAEKYYKQTITLPLYYEMTIKNQKMVIDKVLEVIE